jgi:CxxC motif-containing protein (DUF1111 family)
MKTDVSGVSANLLARRARSRFAVALLAASVAGGCGGDDDGARPAATPTRSATAAATATSTVQPTATAVPTSTPAPPSATATSAPATATASRTSSPVPTSTPTSPFTATATASSTASATSTATATSTGTATSDIFAALGEPLPDASAEQLETFARGREVALRVFDPEDGLGPEFNVVSCAACHEKPVTGGSGGRYRDFLLVRADLPDGSSIPTAVNGVQPQFTLDAGGRRPSDAATNASATRNPIPFFGVGLLAELPEDEILAREDVNDADGDGISGRANFDRGFVGRFGRKAQTVSIEGFIRGPLFNHLGITTDPLPDELKALLPVPSAALDEDGLLAMLAELLVKKAHAQVAAPEEPTVDDDGVPDPEMSVEDLFDLVSFAMLLAAPRPDPPTPASEAGRRRFAALGCASCHVPALHGPRGPVPAYTDLLLHDMGEELADGVAMGLASGSEFRTQPLWGVGAVAPYLHDGRADTLDDAVRMHGGEAAAARDAYVALDADGRAELIAFLESLGGAAQRSDGLLPPDAPIPPPGTLGGPDRELTPEEEALFARGRDIFDRDMFVGEGMGPLFNGDSCRACHFLPTIGGAGPADVDVIRQGILEEGIFTAPPGGTLLPRHATDNSRPEVDADANVFETRQTPAIFGLGFLESIPVEAVLANEDCDNPDPAAVSGCAHFVSLGRLGRLGWKADVPDLAEFARDGMSNELGMTVPEVTGLTFGTLMDGDGAADPEIDEDDLEALAFFMRRLAPPPRRSTDADAEAAGEALFATVGCIDCHVDDFVAPDGLVPYTDLLLHRMAADDAPGIGSGDALPVELRTAPLWGLALTPPYMHDGRAFTIEEAILRHDGEAATARQAFAALSDAERALLLAFLESL